MTEQWKPEDVVIVVPVLNRPHLIDPVRKNVAAMTPDGVRLLFIPDDDDRESIDALTGIDDWVYPNGRRGWAAKINIAAEVYREHRYIFCAADDVIFRDGWLDAVMDVMTGLRCRYCGTTIWENLPSGEWFHESTAEKRCSELDGSPKAAPDTDIRVVGTLDQLNPHVMSGEHSVHFMVDRRYIDEIGGVIDKGPGSFLPDCYHHNFVDTEFIETAKHRGVFAMSSGVVEHAHWMGGVVPYDATYRLGDSRLEQDRKTFFKRRPLWQGGS